MDDIRKLLLFEPRGGPFHNANILVPPAHPEADMGYIILESTEYPPMSFKYNLCSYCFIRKWNTAYERAGD